MIKNDKKKPLNNKYFADEYVEEIMSPVFLIILIPGVVFFSEIAVMILLSFLPPFSTVHRALIDASLLIIFITPIFYFLLFRPLQSHMEKYWRRPKEKEKVLGELHDALDEIKTLRGMLPVCTSCKNIKNDKEYFSKVENYIREHSGTDITCDTCLEDRKAGPD